MVSKVSLIVLYAFFAHCSAETQETNIKEGTEPLISSDRKELRNGCGWHNKDGIPSNIMGGNQRHAKFGEFPWMIVIFHIKAANDGNILRYQCGGSLIAPQWVLTAAHCVDNHVAKQLLVRAGEWDRNKTSEIFYHVDKPVKEIISHKNYDKNNLYNDVALLLVEEPFIWKENILPICLPDHNINFDYSSCYFSGWGKNQSGPRGKFQEILKKIDMSVVPLGTCQTLARRAISDKHFNVHESFLCAVGVSGEAPCEGDSGSPLVCPIPGYKDRFYLAGIDSMGVDCIGRNKPELFANVGYARPWISKILTTRGVPFSYFTP